MGSLSVLFRRNLHALPVPCAVRRLLLQNQSQWTNCSQALIRHFLSCLPNQKVIVDGDDAMPVGDFLTVLRLRWQLF